MKIRRFTIVLLIILAATSAVTILYAGKLLILNRFKALLIERVESSGRMNLAIDAVSYVPMKGICLTGVSFYKNELREDRLLSISRCFVKFSVIKLLFYKTFSPMITVYDARGAGNSFNGVLGVEIKTNVEATSPEGALKAIKSIRFYNFSAKTAAVDLKDLSGTITFSPGSIKSSNLSLSINGEACKLHFTVSNPLGELSSVIVVSSQKIGLTVNIDKKNDIYKISKLEGTAFSSRFDLVGELTSRDGTDGATLSLYGKANVDVKDIEFFVPPDLKKSLRGLRLEGVLENSVYFKTDLRNIQAFELGIKSNAESLKIGNVKLKALRMDTRIKDGVVNMPLFNARLYGGVLNSSAMLDLTDKRLPYKLNCKLSAMDIRPLIKNTPLKGKNVRGVVSSEFSLQGKAKNADSMEGRGRIIAQNANLGPMPLLTPLLGNIYGYFRRVFPELRKVNITGGSADFYVANRRVMTDNLVLTGEAISISARGYIDFDKNLDFEVENKISQNLTGGGGLQGSLQDIVVQFGKFISKARLTGTLDKPKWKFEYLGGIENILKGGLQKLLKDILE
ncbi:MAG: AsmA family protein [Omnitrophica bacterium]|nr:AsmA family protein [Candidatus Omnitrophota bacterium]